MSHFPSRIVDGRMQSVEEHLKQVAKYSVSNLTGCNMQALCELIALYHDCGKYSDEFKRYIENATSVEEALRKTAVRGSVNHTFAGVQLIFKNHHVAGDSYQRLTAELMAFVSGSHHGQFDCLDKKGNDGFVHRLETKLPINLVEKRFYEHAVKKETLDDLFERSVAEINLIFRNITKMMFHIKDKEEKKETRFFYTSLLARLLSSALIDADRRDAMEFFYDTSMQDFDGQVIWERELRCVEQRLEMMEDKNEIDQVRRRISDEAMRFETMPSGIYQLSIPTGSGKTLVGLKTAIAHAKYHNKRRIIFVIPLLSILEQNATVIRSFVSDPAMITEHHSNIVREQVKDGVVDEAEFYTETWHTPIVITTLFQFLNTLFDGSNSSIRRMHSLANSVIVIDEVQQVPKHMLSIFNLAIQFLTGICGASVIFSSATQPAFAHAKRPIIFPEEKEIVPYNAEMEIYFRRTKFIPLLNEMDLEDVEQLVYEQDAKSILVICNQKDQASFLHKKIGEAREEVYHLSTAMCMQHRKDTIAKIKDNLEKKIPTICISTQLVEAGVDFSFACVIRFLAGVDNVVQAAGRCNRHGEYETLCPVYIVNVKENLGRLIEIKEAKTALYSLLTKDENMEIDSKETIERYYKKLFLEQSKSQDYAIEQTTIFQLLSLNKENPNTDPNRLFKQSFKRVGDAFQVFENQTIDVIVPYGKATEVIADLLSEKAIFDFHLRKNLLAKLKGYAVSMYAFQLEKLKGLGAVQTIFDDRVAILSSDFYHEERGVEENFSLLEV
ncbi:MAG: CRISPR-associated helicase Cas3' [Bacillota bacterium]